VISSLVDLDGALLVMPLPVATTVRLVDGWAVLLQAPPGVVEPVSLVVLAADRTVRFVAEPFARPPRHDPYVDVWTDGDLLMARAASGCAVSFDPTSGAATLVEVAA
jgi:hypothetical protein